MTEKNAEKAGKHGYGFCRFQSTVPLLIVVGLLANLRIFLCVLLHVGVALTSHPDYFCSRLFCKKYRRTFSSQRRKFCGISFYLFTDIFIHLANVSLVGNDPLQGVLPQFAVDQIQRTLQVWSPRSQIMAVGTQ